MPGWWRPVEGDETHQSMTMHFLINIGLPFLRATYVWQVKANANPDFVARYVFGHYLGTFLGASLPFPNIRLTRLYLFRPRARLRGEICCIRILLIAIQR
jgi:hypothetical protein